MYRRHLVLIIGFTCLFLCCTSQQKEEQYASMPKELADIHRKIDKNSSDPLLYWELSDYYLHLGRLDSALNSAFSAMRLDSTNSSFYVKLSDIYFAMAMFDVTEAMLEKAVALDKKNNEAYLKLAELYFWAEEYDLAHKNLKKAIEYQTHNPQAYHISAMVFLGKGDTLAAIRNFLIATDQNPDYFDAYLELGVLYQYYYDHSPLALDFYNNALNVKPNSILCLYNIAMFYQETDDYDKALEKYRMILQLKPQDKTEVYFTRNALHNVGWIYLNEKKNYDEAIVFFTKAVVMDSTYVEAVYKRGLCFENLQKYDNARQDYMYSLRLRHNYPSAVEGLNRLDRLQKR
ncbi:MAG: tetratricopeptide repeat protein [Lentimicrobiaceae bacterium]|nr:tetratricopeptide repeat protein [Lentimicrobiaceae bacterium]